MKARLISSLVTLGRFMLVLIFLIPFATALAQESAEQAKTEKDKRPVRRPFEGSTLIDNQTPVIYPKNTLEMIIHHRFGPVKNGVSDLYGIYGPSNIRLGLNYSITNKIMLGLGTTKNKKYQDLQWKYNILQQTRSNSIPVGLAYYGNISLDARNKDYFGAQYQFTNRFSYFSQLIIWHRINDKISVQVAPSFSHINSVDSAYEHDKVAVSFGGKFRFSNQMAFIVNYDLPLHLQGIQEHLPLNIKPSPNLGLGIEISTSTHVFQIFIANAQGILPHDNVMWNTNPIGKIEGYMIGFNLTRMWGF
ncbi:MAG: DUF5777 family beta-barrel protein [Bacteroidales bacterium]|nr:DUF5777 family beta-barrel protein [Bacteroidales bacterium]